MTERVRVRVRISGRVQGVCFRMETQRAASRIGVLGWVRNMRDGRVEAVFEGEAQRVDEILKWCEKGPPLALVNRLEVFKEDYTGEYSDFTIRYTS